MRYSDLTLLYDMSVQCDYGLALLCDVAELGSENTYLLFMRILIAGPVFENCCCRLCMDLLLNIGEISNLAVRHDRFIERFFSSKVSEIRSCVEFTDERKIICSVCVEVNVSAVALSTPCASLLISP